MTTLTLLSDFRLRLAYWMFIVTGRLSSNSREPFRDVPDDVVRFLSTHILVWNAGREQSFRQYKVKAKGMNDVA